MDGNSEADKILRQRIADAEHARYDSWLKTNHLSDWLKIHHLSDGKAGHAPMPMHRNQFAGHAPMPRNQFAQSPMLGGASRYMEEQRENKILKELENEDDDWQEEMDNKFKRQGLRKGLPPKHCVPLSKSLVARKSDFHLPSEYAMNFDTQVIAKKAASSHSARPAMMDARLRAPSKQQYWGSAAY